MRWVAVFLYGAATGGGVLIAGTRGLGVGWDQAYGPSPSAVSGLFWGLMVAGLVVPVWAVRAIVTRSPREWPQTLVPAVLVVLVPFGIAAGGRWQDPWETTAGWVVVALAAHVGVALLTRRGATGRERGGAVVVFVLLVASVVGVERLAQPRWLAKAVAREHIPLLVPVVAGFVPAGVGLGDYTLVVRMLDGGGRTFDVGIRRVKPGAECVALLCAPGAAGYVAYGTAPSGMSLRPSSAAELVRLPRITLQGVEPD
jgi:hypothetical protein